MANIASRLTALEQRMNKLETMPALIFCDDADVCTVCNVDLFRLDAETDDDFYVRCEQLYDQLCGRAPALAVRIQAAERYDDDEL